MIKSNWWLSGGYFLFLMLNCAIHNGELLPFPYKKIPIGLVLGSLVAIPFCWFMLFNIAPKKHTLTKLLSVSIATAFLFALIQGHVHTLFEEFHITTQVSRVSILVGMLLGAIMAAYIKRNQINQKAKTVESTR